MDDMGMGGMDMSSGALFKPTNIEIAKLYWYLVAAVVAVCTIRRACDMLRTSYAKRKTTSRFEVPSNPTNYFTQLYDTLLTISRELTYPQFRPFTSKVSRYFSTLPLGQTLLLVAYWTMLLTMLWSNVILEPSSSMYGYKWEIVGYRAAWVSVTQLPLIYCLGGKANIISILTGISYERLNWLHRWTARTIFLTVIVHWSYFFQEWVLAGFVKDELDMMPMVKYGFGAWGVLGWSVLTGFGFFRIQCYELWLLQHLATAGVLLWLLYCHVPAYAMYNIWLSVAFVAFDRYVRGIWSLIRNLHATQLWKRMSGNQSLLGFDGHVKSHGDGYMSLTLRNADFSWRAGQHVFISMPACGIFESHPFTITNLSENTENSLSLYFKCHSGFTGRLRKMAEQRKASHIRTFVSGPWGNPPTTKIENCNSLIFVASSTGAAYTVPLLEHAVKEAKFVQRVCFYWIVKHQSQVDVFLSRIESVIKALGELKIEAQFQICVTGSTRKPAPIRSIIDEKSITVETQEMSSSESRTSSDDSILPAKELNPMHKHGNIDVLSSTVSSGSSAASNQSDTRTDSCYEPGAGIAYQQGRPKSWDDLLHPTIEAAEGETVIVSCGGRALMADIRNYVAWISDQRGVHKGTGAQGIYLYTETYGW